MVPFSLIIIKIIILNMNNSEIESKLNSITTENYIWIIYLGIIITSWYANTLECNYFIYDDKHSKEKYQQIIIFIFSILLVVYIYFFKSSLNDIKNAKDLKTYKLTELSSIASLLILISGIIFLYISYNDNDINVELAFN